MKHNKFQNVMWQTQHILAMTPAQIVRAHTAISKSKSLEDALNAIIDLHMMGYSGPHHLVRYMFEARWDSPERLGLTTNKAVVQYCSQKGNLVHLMTILQTKVPSVLLEDCAHPMTKVYLHEMEQLKNSWNMLVIQPANRLTNDKAWLRACVFFCVNRWRFKKGQTRLEWQSAQFRMDFNILMNDKNAVAEATEPLHDLQEEVQIEMATLALRGVRPATVTTTEERRCHICASPQHLSYNCPAKRKLEQAQNPQPIKKRKRGNNKTKSKGSYFSNKFQGNVKSENQQTTNVQRSAPNTNKSNRTVTYASNSKPGDHFYSNNNGTLQVKPTQMGPQAIRCRYFAQGKCRHNDPRDCSFLHICSTCSSTEHPTMNCNAGSGSLFSTQ